MFYTGVSKAEQPMFGMELAHPGSLDPILSNFSPPMSFSKNDQLVHVGPDEM